MSSLDEFEDKFRVGPHGGPGEAAPSVGPHGGPGGSAGEVAAPEAGETEAD
jgi:hypothetical protein